MNRINRSVLFLFLVIALLAFSTSVVFAKELGLLTISGPGIKGEVSLNDHEAMMSLEKTGFFDQASLTKPPQNLGEGYNITAHLNLDGKLVPFVQMVYYPTKEGEPAYVHYTARLEGEALQPVDEWYTMSRATDSALRQVMAANNITVQSTLVAVPPAVEPAKEPVAASVEEPVAAPVSSPTPTPNAYLIPALGVSILALLGLALALRRRTVSHPAASSD
jgi:hypothetical protein